MEGSSEVRGWSCEEEEYAAMQRFYAARVHAFQPFQAPSQEHVNGIGMQNLYISPPGSSIPPPPPLIADMVTRSKRKVSEETEEEDVQIVAPPAPKKKGVVAAKKPRKNNVKKEKGEEEDDDGPKNWADGDVEMMISLRGEMEQEFLKNAKKQGVDVWLKLHARLIAVIPGLNRTAEACKKKFNGLYKQYKDDKLANSISGSDRHSCKYYNLFDQWFHQTGTVMKHVTASANNSSCIEGSSNEVEKEQNSEVSPTPSLKTDSKKSFQEQCYGVFTQMAENSTIMVSNFEKTNVLLEKVERQMDRLIDKL